MGVLRVKDLPSVSTYTQKRGGRRVARLYKYHPDKQQGEQRREAFGKCPAVQVRTKAYSTFYKESWALCRHTINSCSGFSLEHFLWIIYRIFCELFQSMFTSAFCLDSFLVWFQRLSSKKQWLVSTSNVLEIFPKVRMEKIITINDNICCFSALTWLWCLFHEGESFKQEFLEAHNAYRKKHRAPPMTFSNELNNSAQKWADNLMATDRLSHSNTKDGENVFSMYGSAGVVLTGLFYTKHVSSLLVFPDLYSAFWSRLEF